MSDKFSVMRGLVKKVKEEAPFTSRDVSYLITELEQIRDDKFEEEAASKLGLKSEDDYR